MFASFKGHPATAKLLLEAGADNEAKDEVTELYFHSEANRGQDNFAHSNKYSIRQRSCLLAPYFLFCVIYDPHILHAYKTEWRQCAHRCVVRRPH
jgi:hypothetical protein